MNDHLKDLWGRFLPAFFGGILGLALAREAWLLAAIAGLGAVLLIVQPFWSTDAT